MLHPISDDCGLPDPSSLVVRPALRFVVVGRATDRVLKGKSAGFHRWYNVIPGRGRIQVGLVENSPQGKEMEFHLGSSYVVGVTLDFGCLFSSREKAS